MTIEVVGSKMKPEAFTGQNGGLNPSVQYPGDKPLPRSTIAQSIMRANKAKAPAPDAPGWQTRPVSAEQKVPTTKGMRSRSVADGTPGGTVPKSLNYKK